MGSITRVLSGIATFPYLDPWTKAYLLGMDDTYYIFAALFLLIPTLAIFKKQWDYYYSPEGKRGGKQGIFQKTIRYVNKREKFTDETLAFAGAFLFPAAFLPVYWFLAFSIYCSLVIFRCVLTLRRKAYARELRKKGEIVRSWYDQSLEEIHNNIEKYKVKKVLIGWILSEIIFIAVGLSLFWFYSSTYFWNIDWGSRISLYIILGIFGIVVMFWTVRLGTERLVQWYFIKKKQKR